MIFWIRHWELGMGRELAQAIGQLSAIPRYGPVKQTKLLNLLTDQGIKLSQIPHFDRCELEAKLGMEPEHASAFLDAQSRVEEEISSVDFGRINVLTRQAEDWPDRLTTSPLMSKIPWLFYRGSRELISKGTVGIGGSRNAAPYSLALTQGLVRQLALHQSVIVSGGARGVDTVAHNTALSAGSDTIVVLAEGLSRWTPPTEWEQFLADGKLLAISEFLPWEPWGRFRAMQRNNTILELSDSFIVMEAGESGGTQAAGQLALKLGVPLFVVQGADGYAGNTLLIERGGTALHISDPAEIPEATLKRIVEHKRQQQTNLGLFG
jgi:DNA processing protein